nr:hypothetical protein [Clostridium chromiireducens]
MNIILKQTKEEELAYLTELEEISFAVNSEYFEKGCNNGILDCKNQ